ncbi:mucin-17-like [Cheilinus undulatus]|uniref:mucin-17-like n=1 Tax=Cheilinus undulatus TaxID=241271 RepID=UPI001BD4193C|nr:mucin-17-like [Cheilinus undulatus]
MSANIDCQGSFPYGVRSFVECVSRAVVLSKPTNLREFLSEYMTELIEFRDCQHETDPKIVAFKFQQQWEEKFWVNYAKTIPSPSSQQSESVDKKGNVLQIQVKAQDKVPGVEKKKVSTPVTAQASKSKTLNLPSKILKGTTIERPEQILTETKKKVSFTPTASVPKSTVPLSSKLSEKSMDVTQKITERPKTKVTLSEKVSTPLTGSGPKLTVPLSSKLSGKSTDITQKITEGPKIKITLPQKVSTPSTGSGPKSTVPLSSKLSEKSTDVTQKIAERPKIKITLPQKVSTPSTGSGPKSTVPPSSTILKNFTDNAHNKAQTKVSRIQTKVSTPETRSEPTSESVSRPPGRPKQTKEKQPKMESGQPKVKKEPWVDIRMPPPPKPKLGNKKIEDQISTCPPLVHHPTCPVHNFPLIPITVVIPRRMVARTQH